MSLGSSLYHARKKSGLSQENVAEKLGVSRQTISKWETDETLPDIRQSKGLSTLYHMTLDELIEYDLDEQQAQQMIDSISEEAQARIDWNKVWSKNIPYWLPITRQFASTTTPLFYRRCSPSCKWTMVTTTPTPCWYSRIFWRGYGRGKCNSQWRIFSRCSIT